LIFPLKQVVDAIKKNLKTTTNFWVPINLILTHRRKLVVFRNGVKMTLNWGDYWLMRNAMNNIFDGSYVLKKIDGWYLIKGENDGSIFFNPSMNGVAIHFHLNLALDLVSKGWSITQVDNRVFQFGKECTKYIVSQLGTDVFDVKSDDFEMIIPHDSVRVFFSDCEDSVYSYDFRDKIVLDVGGFCGETAVFFSSKGAKKVVIYEPVLAHHEFIRRNMKLNNIEAELHEEGVGKKDGIMTVNFDVASLGFGMTNKGKNKLKIKIKDIRKVIEESKADVGKFDCEGAEINLIDVPQETLRKINFYMIEAHTPEIRTAIIDKFERAGFEMSRETRNLPHHISMLYFSAPPYP
jgi:FkbM family methyltransferase